MLAIRREITIEASPERIFALIDDFHNWRAWAPQDVEDPAMARTYSGAASGPGAVSTWQSTGSAGEGRMEITGASSPRLVTVKVDFRRPLEAHNVNTFEIVPVGSATRVTWTMRGTNPFIAKVMSVFANMDAMMGKHFEAGLSNLKSAAEQRPLPIVKN
jgi:uncharacterized protein YndB with AHSA1/START domain